VRRHRARLGGARFSRNRVNNCYIPERMQRTAGTRPDAARRRVVSMALCCGWLLAGCLVTDSIEPPPEPNSPPVVTSTAYPPNKVILFDRTKSARGLTIPVEIRDESTTELLKMRWRVLSGTNPPPAVVEYDCPENPITGNGTPIRDTQQFTVMSSLFLPGLCSVIELVTSAHFLGSCLKNPEPTLFDAVTEGNDARVGRAYFWVWEVSNDPLTNNEAAQRLLSSCPDVPYQVSGATPGIGTTTAQTP
jgi:hypothetical protein